MSTIQVCVEGTLSLAITFIKPLPVDVRNTVSEVTVVIKFTHKRPQKKTTYKAAFFSG